MGEKYIEAENKKDAIIKFISEHPSASLCHIICTPVYERHCTLFSYKKNEKTF